MASVAASKLSFEAIVAACPTNIASIVHLSPHFNSVH